MNELQIFNSEEFGDIRTVTIENEPYQKIQVQRYLRQMRNRDRL